MDSKILDILMDITEEEERNLLGQKHKNTVGKLGE